MVFSEVVGTLSFLQPQADDDMADRLHYYYTTTFLLVTSVLISLKMYGGRPIECWMPAEYQNSWQEYTEIYCFSMNTYFASFSADIPNETEKRERNMISYYQWTPFFLVICAFLFYSPCLIWRVLYTKSGIRIKDIVAFANDRSNIQPKMREANMKGMSAHLGSVFRHRFRLGGKHPYHHKFLRVLNLRFYEAYLTFLYIGIKMLFLGNVTVQMFLMNWFLQTSNYRYYGFGVLQDLIYGRPWSDSGNFPRVTYCDLDVRILGNVQKHTVQCVLVINIYIEKVFVLLWIWYSLLLVVTLFSLVNWIFSSFPFEARKRFIARRLELADVEFKRANFEEELEDFVRYHIKMDGVFMLRMLTIHAGILVCTEVVDAMWEEFIDGLAGASERAKSLTESAVIASPASAASSLPPAPFRRKMSVLVPLVSAQPDGQHQSGFSFLQHQSLSGSLNVHQQEAQPSGSAAISSAGAGLGAASTLVPKGEFHLKRPNALEWRTGRRLHSAGDAKKGSLDTSVGSSNGGRRRYPRRTSHGVPMLSAVFGGALATLTRARSHSATQQPLEQVEEGQVSQPPPTHRPQRARRDLLETHSDVEEVVELLEEEEHQRQREEEERERNSSSSTWHGGAAQRRAK